MKDESRFDTPRQGSIGLVPFLSLAVQRAHGAFSLSSSDMSAASAFRLARAHRGATPSKAPNGRALRCSARPAFPSRRPHLSQGVPRRSPRKGSSADLDEIFFYPRGVRSGSSPIVTRASSSSSSSGDGANDAMPSWSRGDASFGDDVFGRDFQRGRTADDVFMFRSMPGGGSRPSDAQVVLGRDVEDAFARSFREMEDGMDRLARRMEEEASISERMTGTWEGQTPQTYRREQRSEKALPGGGYSRSYYSESITTFGPAPGYAAGAAHPAAGGVLWASIAAGLLAGAYVTVVKRFLVGFERTRYALGSKLKLALLWPALLIFGGERYRADFRRAIAGGGARNSLREEGNGEYEGDDGNE